MYRFSLPTYVAFALMLLGTSGIITAGVMNGDQFTLAFLSGQVVGGSVVCFGISLCDDLKYN